jgi:prephenate dehydrogenase (NADP+)
MWLGITEYLFRTPALLEETINTAMGDDTFRGDDLEFTFAARVHMSPPLVAPVLS